MAKVYDIKPPISRQAEEPLPALPHSGFFDFAGVAALGRWLTSVLIAIAVVGSFILMPAALRAPADNRAAAAEEPTQAELEQKLREIEAQIVEQEQTLKETQVQGKTLQDEISRLDARIKKLNLQISATELAIKRLSLRIIDTTKAIEQSELKIARAKTLLERSLRAIYENDRVSLLEVMLANVALSDFFSELSAQNSIQVQAQLQLDEIRQLKEDLENQKQELMDEKDDQTNLLAIQASQRQEVAGQRRDKDQLLTVTKGKEALYQQLLKQSQKTAAEIRAQLYKLLGGGEIKFEDALRYAEFAASYSDIRPALLLAVMDRETRFGQNIGRCSWRTAMNPTHDQPLLLQITKELGLDPDLMLVSCPISQDGSYGGAMGVAQFLPSTWMLYHDRVQDVVNRPPSPWNPQDAFLATAFYLKDAMRSADCQSYSREIPSQSQTLLERCAAAKYYAGSRWRLYRWTYGDRVLRVASYWQEQIDILKRTASL